MASEMVTSGTGASEPLTVYHGSRFMLVVTGFGGSADLQCAPLDDGDFADYYVGGSKVSLTGPMAIEIPGGCRWRLNVSLHTSAGTCRVFQIH